MIEEGAVSPSMSDLADAAFAATAEHVIRRARETGTEIVLWRNGGVVKMSPDEITRELDEAIRPDRGPK